MPLTNPAVVNVSAGTTSNWLSQVTFSNSNGISFGLNGSTITGSHNALTTAMASNRGSDFVQATAAFAGTSASGTIASGGISISIGPYLTTAALSNHSHGVSFTSGSVAFQTLSFTNSNGISFNSGTQGIFGSHNAITTGALSGDTTKYVQAWEITGNTAGTTSSLPGTKVYFSGGPNITLSGNGNTIVVSAGAAGGAVVSNAIQDVGTATGSGTNTSRFAADDHVHRGVGAIAAVGTATTFYGSVHFSGGNNVTLSTGGASNAGTIAIHVAAPGGGATYSHFHVFNGPMQATTSLTSYGNSAQYVEPFFLPAAMSISYIRIPVSVGKAGTGTATTAARSWSFNQSATYYVNFYTMGVGANSRSLQYVAGGSEGVSFACVYQVGAASNNQSCSYSATVPSEGAQINYTTSFGVSSASITLHTTVLSNSIVGNKWLDIRFTSSLAPGAYWVAIQQSSTTASTSAGGNWANITAATSRASVYGVSQIALPIRPWGVATTNSSNVEWQYGQGLWTTNSNGRTTSSMALSNIITVGNAPIIPFIFVRQA